MADLTWSDGPFNTVITFFKMNKILKVSYFQETTLLCTKEANFLVEGTEKAILDLTLRKKIFGLENRRKACSLIFAFCARIYRPAFSGKQAQNARIHLIENERFGWFSRKQGL